MPVLSIPYGDELLVATGQSRQELEAELRFLLAAKLYELGRVSGGMAGELAGMSRLHFLDELGRRGFTVIHLDPEEVEGELRDDLAAVRRQ